ncbi:MAG: hypothetical protein ABIH25_00290 [Candidatus Woesearchaeota archaeon]
MIQDLKEVIANSSKKTERLQIMTTSGDLKLSLYQKLSKTNDIEGAYSVDSCTCDCVCDGDCEVCDCDTCYTRY